MSRSRTTLAITVLTVLTITLSARANYRDGSKAIKISGGEDHTLVVTANNWAWACGPNGYRYQDVTYYSCVLGIGSNDPYLKRNILVRIHGPGDVGYLEGIYDISAGWQHSLGLDVNDSVWSWGWNSKGQLGIGTLEYKSVPVQVLRGDQPDDPCQPSAYLKHITDISAGRSGQHSLAVDAEAYAFAWGYNEYGQCGNDQSGNNKQLPVYVRQGEQPDDPNDPNDWLKHIIAVSAGSNNSIALEADDANEPNLNLNGCVYTWGCNMWGEEFTDTMITDGWGLLGNGSGSAVNFSDTPVKVLRGEQDYNEPGQVYLEHIVAVSAGWDHLMALEKYEVYDPFEPNYDPNHKGRVYTWGNNGDGWDSGGGRLGNGSATDGNSTPVLVLRGEQPPDEPNDTYPYLCHIVAVSAGEGHSMALDVNGYVYTWGDNQHGQLGNGTNDPCTTPVRVINPQDPNLPLPGIVAISAGYWHSLAIDANGVIWTWGKGAAGRLGLADKTIDCNMPHPIPVVYNVTQETFAFAIQPAIDDANEGDVLEASPGIYYENVVLASESITLQSEDPQDATIVSDTIIDARYNAGAGANYYYPAVDFNDSSGSTLAGLTLVKGTGGGVLCENMTSAKILYCSIHDNEWHGIRLIASSADIQNCDIRANISVETYDTHGIYCVSASDVNIANCVVAGNAGNGIYLYASGVSQGPEIANNWIYGNGGSGVKTDYISSAPDPLAAIVNNTIVRNDEYGVQSNWATDVVITNCIIWDNASGSLPSSGYTVRYSCVEGTPVYSGEGNITNDPCFVDAEANDFHLAADSACIDAGDPDFEADVNETDIDGEPRVMDGDANDTVIVDMGADEFYHSPADYNDDGLVNFIDYAMLTSYWQDAGIDYNDVFLYGDSNSVGLAEFCDEWLWEGGFLSGSMPLMGGPSGGGMTESLSLQEARYELTAVEEKTLIAEPVDVKRLVDWLADVWLDPELQQRIDAEAWLKLYESVKELE